MIPTTNWEPSRKDIEWQEHMMRLLINKASWAVPGTASIFEIDKDSKTFKLVVGNPEEETNRRIAKVFKRLGFSEFGTSEPENPLDRFNGSNN
jgi:hypothetical protein